MKGLWILIFEDNKPRIKWIVVHVIIDSTYDNILGVFLYNSYLDISLKDTVISHYFLEIKQTPPWVYHYLTPWYPSWQIQLSYWLFFFGVYGLSLSIEFISLESIGKERLLKEDIAKVNLWLGTVVVTLDIICLSYLPHTPVKPW